MGCSSSKNPTLCPRIPKIIVVTENFSTENMPQITKNVDVTVKVKWP